MTLNPEFRRNLWLEFTPLRIALVGALLLLALAAAAAADYSTRNWRFGKLDALAQTARAGFYVLVVIWGGWQAAAAIVTEARERTWDAQRMSALSPWAMGWGKLLGVTALGWLYGLACVAIYIAASEADGVALIEAAKMIGTGLLCQGSAMFASLIRSSARAGAKPGNATLLFLVALGMTGFVRAVPEFAQIFARIDSGQSRFFDLRIGARELQAISVCAFGLIVLGGIYWRMRLALQIVTRPWMWLVLLAALAVLVGGVVPSRGSPAAIGGAVAATFGLAVYGLVLIEPKDIVQFRRMLGVGGRISLNNWFTLTPLWLLTYLALLLAVAIELALVASGHSVVEWEFSAVAGQSLTYGLVALALFVTRDIGIVLIFALRRDSRRAEVFGFLCWLALYLPLPLLFASLMPWRFLSIFFPLGTGGFAFSVLPALVQAVLVLVILALRWRRHRVAA